MVSDSISQQQMSDETDVSFNRNGSLSPRQQARLNWEQITEGGFGIVVIICGVLIALAGIASVINGHDWPNLVCGFVMSIPVILLGAAITSAQFTAGHVQQLEGVVDDVGLDGDYESAEWVMQSGEHVFYTTLPFVISHLQQSSRCTFFYVLRGPRKRKYLLSWERKAG